MEVRQIIDLIMVGLVIVVSAGIAIYKARNKTKTTKKL